MASFLVVEHPGLQSPGIAVTRLHPDLLADFLIEVPPAGRGTELKVVLQVQAGTREARQVMQATVADTYGGLRLLPSPDPDTWVGALRIPMSALGEPELVLARFASENGLEVIWGRVEEGVTFARILVVESQRIGALADELRRRLDESGIDADVGIEAESNVRLLERLRAVKELLGPAETERF